MALPREFTKALRRDPEHWQSTPRVSDGWLVATDGTRAHAMRDEQGLPEDKTHAHLVRFLVHSVAPALTGELDAETLSRAVGVSKRLGKRWTVALDLASGELRVFFNGKKRTAKDDARRDSVRTSELIAGAGIPGEPPAVEVGILADAVAFTGTSTFAFSPPSKRWGRTDPIRLENAAGTRFAVVMPTRV